MTPQEALRFAESFALELPDGWGFLAEAQDFDGAAALVLTETPPALPVGWILWLSKRITGGRILKAGVFFSEDDTPQDVEAKAWAILGRLQITERQDAARWN